jgi:hypothetical protein
MAKLHTFIHSTSNLIFCCRSRISIGVRRRKYLAIFKKGFASLLSGIDIVRMVMIFC